MENAAESIEGDAGENGQQGEIIVRTTAPASVEVVDNGPGISKELSLIHIFLDFEELTIIYDSTNYLVHIVRLVRVIRNDVVQGIFQVIQNPNYPATQTASFLLEALYLSPPQMLNLQIKRMN